MLQCLQLIWIICSWEKWETYALSSFHWDFTWQCCIFYFFHEKQSTVLWNECEWLIIFWKFGTQCSNAFVSSFVSFISIFFRSFKEPKCQTDDGSFKHSLAKICIHGYTTVRTANIRVTLFFFYCSILPKSKQLLVRGKFHINIVLTSFKMNN